MPTPARHFGSGTGSVSSSGSSSNVGMTRRAKLTDEEEEKLRAGMKASSIQYFANAKTQKEAGLRRLRQRRGPFKMQSSTPIKYGPNVSERPVAKRRSPLKMVDIGRPAPQTKGVNEDELPENQRALLRRMRRRAS